MKLPDSKETGVYLIVNRVNNKVYVGSATVSFYTRAKSHRSTLRRGVHPNRHLQNAWNKYGEESFDFKIVVICYPDRCLLNEQRLIDRLLTCKKGYNTCPTAGSVRGYRHTEDTKKRMSESHAKRVRPKMSDETRAKMSAQRRGRKLPPEWVANMAAARAGKPKTEAHKARIGMAHWSKGPNAEEIRAKIASANAKRIWSEESKMKMSESKKKNNGVAPVMIGTTT